jgi:putative ABC transport system permease protein
MPLLEAVRLALQQIRVQKLKSFFTTLGVLIGVMFLIAVVSIVQGMSDYVEDEVVGKLVGGNTVTVRRFNFSGEVTEEMWREMQRWPRLMPEDVQAIRAALPANTASAIVSGEEPFYAVSRYARRKQVFATAVDGDYFGIKRYNLSAGRVFTPQEVALGAPVLVLGDELAEHFFPSLDPIGRELRLGGVPYQVVGVIEKQGSIFGMSLDRMAVAPYTSAMARLTNPAGDVDRLTIQATTPEMSGELAEMARETMRSRRKLGPSDRDTFGVETSDADLAEFNEIKGRVLAFGTALPAIGLIVGALVIMNIMLVAVAERTREIGIRKALGARRKDILRQFLVEAAMLSVLGAALGIALGYGAASALKLAFPALPVGIAPWSIAVALAMGAGVGVIAGAYPAARASKLDPITALRAE